jgi:DNA-binding NtrC family response regulator
MSDKEQGDLAAGAVPRPADESDPGPPPVRILILEDDPWDAERAKRLLSTAGVRFTAVVVDTLEAFTEQIASLNPEVILSDYQLPGFTGADALKVAQEKRPDIPFIVWSGALGDEAAVGLIKQGATDYILKDRPARLPSAVERAVAEARQRGRLAQIEANLGRAQHLASVGQLRAAEQAVAQTRQMLDSARQEMAAPDA